MRSFVFVLISAALATFVGALPLHVNQRAELPGLQLPGLDKVGQPSGGQVARDLPVKLPNLPEGRRSNGGHVTETPAAGLPVNLPGARRSSDNPVTGGQLSSVEGQLGNIANSYNVYGMEDPVDALGSAGSSVGSGAGDVQTRDQPNVDKLSSTDLPSVVPSSVGEVATSVEPGIPKRESQLLPVGSGGVTNALSGVTAPQLSGDGAGFNENV